MKRQAKSNTCSMSCAFGEKVVLKKDDEVCTKDYKDAIIITCLSIALAVTLIILILFIIKGHLKKLADQQKMKEIEMAMLVKDEGQNEKNEPRLPRI